MINHKASDITVIAKGKPSWYHPTERELGMIVNVVKAIQIIEGYCLGVVGMREDLISSRSPHLNLSLSISTISSWLFYLAIPEANCP